VREVVRYNQRRQIALTSDVHDRGIGAVWEDVQRVLAGVPPPEGVTLVRGGEQEEISQSLPGPVVGTDPVGLARLHDPGAQFESFLDPFIISTVLPVVWWARCWRSSSPGSRLMSFRSSV